MSKFETLSPKYSASVSADAGVALGAHAHTAASSVLNYVRCKNCVSVFRCRPYDRRVHSQNIVISVLYSLTVMQDVFCFIFYLTVRFEDTRVSVRISIAGSLN